ncbi:hypothetical protein UFOVP783_108 [uncultured Caudovirales phage]|uniref:Uncharacterized protein n=1 Tax=uncultured Caudovirales phage TaxID=2100421 RepID=A0A6J5P053_9CAUD|nr:hypothetical protein UFOVP783_108 [uncultured Caudovirales phage]
MKAPAQPYVFVTLHKHPTRPKASRLMVTLEGYPSRLYWPDEGGTPGDAAKQHVAALYAAEFNLEYWGAPVRLANRALRFEPTTESLLRRPARAHV